MSNPTDGTPTPEDVQRAMAHPDDAPPSRELKDIALKAAGASARKDREVDELAGAVAGLSSEVTGLRTEVGNAVRQDELRSSQRHTLRVIFWPLIVGAAALVVITLGVGSLYRLARGNHDNGALIIGCTTPAPPGASPKVVNGHACYARSTANTGEAIRQLDCVELLANGLYAKTCEDVRTKLADQGVVWPPLNPPPPTGG